MIYDVAAIAVLARACAPEIATEAVVPLVLTESRGDPLQININGGPRMRAGSIAEGVAVVRRYVSAGYTVDVGLAQINSANFAPLGVTIEQAFEPCTNLRLASRILQQGFGTASRLYRGMDAISATYSLYNTGSLTRGFRNGYVDRVWTAAVGLGSVDARPSPPAAVISVATRAPVPAPAAADSASWVVGQMAPGVIEVFK